ncbi:MAG: hypothetical protein APR63_05030 [Desulfuromonas sp. SDB]|nr:MAG: hypothetical protein APR63_05030 [Desulfuromonas sp. SDB]
MKTKIPNSPYPELPGVLDHLTQGVKEILGDNLVGSLATGGFDLDSDVDFLTVILHDLTDNDVQNLQEMHRNIHDQNCYPAKHLEGSYIPKDFLANEKTMINEKIWYLDNGSRTLELSNHDNRWHVHWVLRERGIRLWGPDSKTLCRPIPKSILDKDVIRVMNQVTDGFREELSQPLGFYNSRFGQSFVILTMCRILQTLASGTIESKLAGVNWAKKNLDDKWIELIDQAWQEREGVRFCIKIKQRAEQSLLEKTYKFIEYAQQCSRLEN